MPAQPLFVSSGDLVADRRYAWALDYLKKGDPAAAADILEQVVETAPNFATACLRSPASAKRPAMAPAPLLRSSGQATPTATTITARGCIWPGSASAKERPR